MTTGQQQDGPGANRWQAEADLLAAGRRMLERLSRSTRYRYLYPEGANLAILLEAYQVLDRHRAVRHRAGRSPKRDRRILRRLVRRGLRGDALARNRRLQWKYPLPRPVVLPTPEPPVVQRALEQVDDDARETIRLLVVAGQQPVGPAPDQTIVDARRTKAHVKRGLIQFREALVNEALARPSTISSLHPQYLRFVATPMPRRRRHPILTLLLVKLPMYLWLLIILLFNVAYLGAFAFFNGEVLGKFVSDRVSSILDGEIRMESIYWRPRMIVDLLTGTPTPLVIEGVTVYEPFKSVVDPKQRKAAYAEELHATMVLHEIIPWNRLGIPRVFEIPWILHFGEVEAKKPLFLDVRQYATTTNDGQSVELIGLRDAFQTYDFEAPPGARGLSVYVDEAHVDRAILTMDFTDVSIWGVSNMLRDVDFGLWFDAPDPDFQPPEKLPFRFHMSGRSPQGTLAIREFKFPLRDVDIPRFDSGTDGAPLGDVEFELRGGADGSPVVLQGGLRDVFERRFAPGEDDPIPVPTKADANAFTPDAGPLVDSLVRQLELEDTEVDAHGDALAARVEGPLGNPTYYLAAEDITIDALAEPAWIMDDVDVSASLTTKAVPEMWERWRPPDAQRYIVDIDTFEGEVLDGQFALTPDERDAHIVFPEPDSDEPWLLSADLQLERVDPARLVPEQPEMGKTLAGSATGGLDLGALVLQAGPEQPEPSDPTDESPETPTGGVRYAALEFDEVGLQRARGPEQDNLPRNLAIDGSLVLESDGALHTHGLQTSTSGGDLQIRGGIDGEYAQVRSTTLDLNVYDGPEFLRAFGLEPYFDTLMAKLTVAGPVRALSGKGGQLAVSALGQGRLGPTDVTEATMWMQQGTLHLRSPDAELFGGHGSVEVDLVLSDGTRFLEHPKVQARIDLKNVDLARLVGEEVRGRANLELAVDDGQGSPARFSEIRVHGKGFAPTLALAGTHYGNASAEFELTAEQLRVIQLTLPIHRVVSPFHAPQVTVPIGELRASGTIGLEDDPSLDLEVLAHGVPFGVVAELFDQDLPARGQIAQGSRLRVGGSVARPRVEGRVALAGLNVGGIPLGSGTMRVASNDVESHGPLAAHRELRAQGEFSARTEAGERDVDWTLDAVLAIGKSIDPDTGPPFSAQARIYFHRLGISRLLAATELDSLEDHMQGRLEGLTARALTCSPGAAMLSDCRGHDAPKQSLQIDLELDRLWMRDRHGRKIAGDPCSAASALCSHNELHAAVDWPMVRLKQPWKIGAGGRNPALLEIRGDLDFSTPSEPATKPTAACTPGTQALPPTSGRGRAQIEGGLDLRALEPLFQTIGLTPTQGRLELALELMGHAANPRVTGTVELPKDVGPLDLGMKDLPVSVEIDDLDLEIANGTLFASTRVRAEGQILHIGKHGGSRTYYTFAGPCQGMFALAAQGALGGKLIEALTEPGTLTAEGTAGLKPLLIQGRVRDDLQLEHLRGTILFNDRYSMRLGFPEGIEAIETRTGRIEFQRCTEQSACPGGRQDGAYGVFVGGQAGIRATRRPSGALDVDVGERGRAQLWGQVYFPESFAEPRDGRLYLNLDDVTYRAYDARGRPKLEAEVSSEGLLLQGGDPVVVQGAIDVERSRWLKDTLEGANVLRVTEEVEAPEAPPPEIVRSMQFNVDVRTSTPLRIDNNIATGVETRVIARVTGTYDDPEIQGRIDVEPGGTVELPFISGTFEVQEGRVLVEHDIDNAQVDVLAVRTDPIYIQDIGNRQLSVRLVGPLKAIGWECDAGVQGARALDSKRACLDYLMFGTGDVPNSRATARRPGSGGLLYPRKGLQVLGNVAELDVTEQLEESVPRVETYIPDVSLQLGQVGPELEVSTPREWFDFEYGRASVGFEYTRGYPGFLLRQNREFRLSLEILEPFTLEMRQSNRSYLNERIIFDPLLQRSIEAGFVFEIPSAR